MPNSELMMGAWFQQDRCVEFLVESVGLTLADAWRQCSEIPAAMMGLKLPKLAPGEEASFVLAHWDKGLVLDQAVHFGQPVLEAPIRPSASGDGYNR